MKSFRLRWSFLFLGLLVGARGWGAAEVAAPVAPAAPAVPVTTLTELQAALEAHVSQSKFLGALWGVKVMSLDSGRVLYEHAPTRRMSPASNSKLYVGALALDALGGDFQIRTPLLASAAVNAAGELTGDLIVSGRGDPSWDPRRAKQEFMTVFEPCVAVLKKAGVRRIAGDVVADGTFYRGTPQGASWTVDDMNDDYGAEISAITLNDNFVDLRISPAATVGAPCTVELLQPHTGLEIDNRSVTTAAGGTPRVRVLRVPGETTVQIFGELPLGGKELLTEATVPRPAQWFANGLKAALERAGIAVGGRARGVRWPEATAVGPGAVALGEVVSPPLRELVAHFMKESQNLQTDLIFAQVGEAQRGPATPTWARTDELAVKALGEFLARQGLRADEVIFDEGSGLSRNNLTTAAATAALLNYMATHREAAAFAAAQPVAGVDGTLRRRMKGTAAEGNVRAKTGGLRWVASLSGYVTAANGERLVFSVILNRHVGTPERSASREVDEIPVLLARYGGVK
jgi:D-alanyl-D-alanine carboxypeptidase/D-alanyl-D-alanine-endopeptidase (penicillin-binding protein 4)